MKEEKEPKLYSAGDQKESGAEQPEISLELRQELRDIAQRVGGDFGMEVKIGEAGSDSFFDAQEVSITLDPEHISGNPELARFVAVHEGAHRAITPGPRKIGLTREQTEEYYSQLGFGYLQNVIEDGAVNNWGSRRFPAIESDMNKVYDEQFAQENAILSTPEVQQAAAKLGYWPKFAQAGSEYLRQWHQGRYSQQLDEQVAKALRRTGEAAQGAMAVIPDPTATVRDEREVLQKGQKRFETTRDRIWPEFKKLVEQDKQTEARRQMINDQEAYEQMPQELKDAIAGAIEQQRRQQEEAGEQPPPSESPGQGGEAPLPFDELSDEVKKQLEEAWKNLPREKQQELERKAAERFEAFEDALNKGMRGKLQRPEDMPETHGERHAREEREREAAAKSRQADADRRRLEQQMENQRRESLTPYERIRADMGPLIDDLHRRLRVILLPEEFGGEEAGWPSGQQLDVSRAMQAEVDPIQQGKLWIRESEPGKSDYRFWHLVDVSGSMEGEAIDETLKGVVVASEAIDRLENRNSDTMEVHQGISAFHNRYFDIKDTRSRIDSQVTDRIASLPERTDDDDAGTNTYRATANALESLQKNLGESGNYLLTFTDGEPNHDIREQLQRLLKDGKADRQKRNIQIGVIWLAEDASEGKVQRIVEEYGYDFGLAMPAVSKPGEKDFAAKLADLQEELVRRGRA